MASNRFFFLWVFLLLASLLPLAAQAGEALINSETDVDVTGKDAADARAQAMAKGEIAALASLLEKLATPEQADAILSGLDANKVNAMVRSTEVLDEKMSNNRYKAHLMVTFDGDEISNLIGKIGAANGGANSEQLAVGSFLVIPAYEEGDTTMLWEDANPWRSVWKSAGLEVASGDIVVPFGDAKDAGVVNSRNVASATFASLLPMTVRYGVSDIVVVQAKFTRSPEMVLNVVKRHINRTTNEVNMLTYRADPQETKDTLLARAARDIADILQHKKIEEMETVKTVHGGERNSVMMLATISTLASWTQLRAKISALPMVDRIELLAMSPKQVDMMLYYRGTPDSLSNALVAQNIRLVKNPRYWVVSRD